MAILRRRWGKVVFWMAIRAILNEIGNVYPMAKSWESPWVQSSNSERKLACSPAPFSVCVYAGVCGGQSLTLVSSSVAFHIIFWNRVSYWTQGSLTDRLVARLSVPPATGVTDVHSTLLHGCWWFKFMPSCLQDLRLTISLAPFLHPQWKNKGVYCSQWVAWATCRSRLCSRHHCSSRHVHRVFGVLSPNHSSFFFFF